MRRFYSLFFGIMSCGILIAHADPRMWGEEGIPIRQGNHIQWTTSGSARDEVGNTLFVWSDMRSGSRDIYAQLVDTSGQLLWPDSGINVSQETHHQTTPMASAVDGGWIVSWTDYRHDSTHCGEEGDPPCGTVYAQKLDHAGIRLWSNNGFTGVRLATEPSFGRHVVHDGEGGALVVWASHIAYDFFHVRRVSGSGDTLWTQAVPLPWSYNYKATQSTGGGIIFVFDTPPEGDIFAAKMSNDGELVWGATGVVPVCNESHDQQTPYVVSDGAGGCYIVWQDRRNDWQDDLYAQRLNNAGESVWQVNGIPVCMSPQDQYNRHLALSHTGDAADGLLVAWEDYRTNGNISEIYSQKISPEGTPVWQANGVFVAGDANSNRNVISPKISSDLDGGLICVFGSQLIAQVSDYDLYVQRLESDGAEAWQHQGVRVTEQAHDQWSALVSSTPASVFIGFYQRPLLASEGIRCQVLDRVTGSRMLEPDGRSLISGFSGNANELRTVQMSQGRTAFVWSDGRLYEHGNALFYQIVNSSGSVELTQNGEMLAPDNTGHDLFLQNHPEICEDGFGGFFLCFVDNRTGVKKIRISYVDPSGEIWSADSGNLVWGSESRDQISAFVTSDGIGGCYVAWSGYMPNFWLDVWVMRMNGQFQPAWAQPVRLSESSSDDVIRGLESTENGCIAVWESGPFDDVNVSAARVNLNGTIAWNIEVASDSGWQGDASAIADGSGGVYTSWTSAPEYFGEESHIYAQHISANGQVYWPESGVPIYTGAERQTRPQMTLDGHGNLYVGWQDLRNGEDYHVFAQKISPTGQRLWDSTGVPIARGSHVEGFIMAPDAHDGFFGAWAEARTLPFANIFATHFDSSGTLHNDPFWIPDSGGPLSDELESYRHDPSMVFDGSGGCVAAWLESREHIGGEYHAEVFAQRIFDFETSSPRPNDLFPFNYSLHQNYPNPFNPITEIAYDLPQASDVRLTVFDLLGREVKTLVNEKLAAGHHNISFDASALPSGVYIYRLRAGDFLQSRKMIILK